MKRIQLDPPGTWCLNHALIQVINQTGARTFLEVGCGRGAVSALLCKAGLTGTGIDFSDEAVAMAEATLAPYTSTGAYKLMAGNFMEMDFLGQFDAVLGLMVMEHVEDDAGFLRQLAGNAAAGGYVVVALPGRPSAWGIEDELAGHFRRYDKEMVRSAFSAANLQVERILSVSVPVANLTLWFSNAALRRSPEAGRDRSQVGGTKRSGIWDIPYKTVFPAPFKLILNRFALAPLIYGQHLFYNTDWGLILLAVGRRTP